MKTDRISVTFNEQLCLDTNPFEGDFGNVDDVVLKDKIVTNRKETVCCMCKGKINKKERVRVLVSVFDGDLCSYRWCSECCEAMASSWEDDGKKWEERIDLYED